MQQHTRKSEVITELCELMKINKTFTTPYHPQSDGKNENSHKFLMQIVRILVPKTVSVPGLHSKSDEKGCQPLPWLPEVQST